jgi:hypothetical protein
VFSLVLGPEVAGPCLGATIVATEVALEVSHIVLAIELDKCGSDYKKCVEEESKKEKEACNK